MATPLVLFIYMLCLILSALLAMLFLESHQIANRLLA